MAPKKNKNREHGKPTQLDGRTDAAPDTAGDMTDTEAADAVHAALEASDDREDGEAAEETGEEASEDVTAARKKATADQSPSSVQPTLDNANMVNDGDHGLTPGMRANLEEDDPRSADPLVVEGANASLNPDAGGDHVEGTPLERARALDINDEATDKMDTDAAAKAVGIHRGRVLGHAVRGKGKGEIVVVVDTSGKKHAAAL